MFVLDICMHVYYVIIIYVSLYLQHQYTSMTQIENAKGGRNHRDGKTSKKQTMLVNHPCLSCRLSLHMHGIAWVNSHGLVTRITLATTFVQASGFSLITQSIHPQPYTYEILYKNPQKKKTMAFVGQRGSGFHMGSWNEKAENTQTWQLDKCLWIM